MNTIETIEQIKDLIVSFDGTKSTDFVAMKQLRERFNESLDLMLKEKEVIRQEKLGRGRPKRKVVCLTDGKEYECSDDAAMEYGLSRQSIRESAMKRKIVDGKKFVFID